MSNAPKVQQRGAFGQINTVELDTNRPDRTGETLWRAGNMIALPSHAIYSDALFWILTPAVSLRVIQHLVAYSILPMTGAIGLIAFFLLPPLVLIGFVSMQRSQTHTVAATYRLCLLIAGLLLAIL